MIYKPEIFSDEMKPIKNLKIVPLIVGFICITMFISLMIQIKTYRNRRRISHKGTFKIKGKFLIFFLN